MSQSVVIYQYQNVPQTTHYSRTTLSQYFTIESFILTESYQPTQEVRLNGFLTCDRTIWYPIVDNTQAVKIYTNSTSDAVYTQKTKQNCNCNKLFVIDISHYARCHHKCVCAHFDEHPAMHCAIRVVICHI